jgi:alpha-tubulin suppressor-like RCC1 family protein
MACGCSFPVAVTEDGELLAWGVGKHGGLELGQGDSSTVVCVQVFKERPQQVRFNAIFPAKGAAPLDKVEVS